jgi:hypothetical protein
MLNSDVPSGAVTANRDSIGMRNHNKQTSYNVNIFVEKYFLRSQNMQVSHNSVTAESSFMGY